MCEGGRVTVTPVSPQKTVYGANVIVFEGILAFANKELLKVLLPDAAGHPLQGAARGQACSRVLHGGWARCWALGGSPGRGHPLLAGTAPQCWRRWGGSAGRCCCEGGHSWPGCARGSTWGVPRGCSLLPVFQLLDMKVFVDTDSDIRLVRRLQRDIMERGRDIVGVIKQYNKFVKPAFEQYIEPTVQVADIVVPRGEMRHVG